MTQYTEVLKFWFEEIKPKMWFTKDLEFDKEIKKRFQTLHEEIVNNNHMDWENDPNSALALILVLDQFSRNMFRDTKQAFEYDKLALNLAKQSVNKGFDLKVEKGRNFFYLPFMHSENLEDQNTCVELFTKLAQDTNQDVKETTHYAILHRNIIEKFNRFPHRNEILGRKSTEDEIEFLKQPNSSF